MKRIAAKGKIDEASLITYIVNGVTDVESTRLLLAQADDFAELRDSLNRLETVLLR